MCRFIRWELIIVIAVVILCPLYSSAAGLEEEFRSKIDSVVSNVSSAKAVVKSLQKKVRDLENEKAKLLFQLEENKGLIKELKEALSKESSAVSPRMKDILAKLESKIIQLRKIQAEMIEELSSKNKRIENLETQLSHKEAEAAGKILPAVKEKIAYKPLLERSQKIENLNLQAKAKDKEIADLKEELAQLKLRKESSQKTIDGLNKKIVYLNTANENLDNALKDKERKVNEFISANEALKKKLLRYEDLDKSVRDIKKSVNEKYNEINMLKNKLKDAQDNYNALRVKYKDSIDEIDKVRLELAGRRKESVGIAAARDSLEKEIAAELAVKEKIKSRARDLSRQLVLKDKEIYNIKQSEAKRERQLQLKIQSLVETVDAKNKEIIEAKERIDTFSVSRQSQKIKELNDKIREKDDDIINLKEKLNRRVNKKTDDIVKLQREISKKDKRIVYLEGVIEETLRKMKAFSTFNASPY